MSRQHFASMRISTLWRVRCGLALNVLLLTLCGCVSAGSGEKSSSLPHLSEPRSGPIGSHTPEPQSPSESSETKAEPSHEAGQMAGASGFQGELLLGLDGELYLPYEPVTVMLVQSALRNRGLYSGPVSGVLDRRTMEAIYEFQAANHYLQRCGIPTPRTRKLLEQGAHTDVTA